MSSSSSPLDAVLSRLPLHLLSADPQRQQRALILLVTSLLLVRGGSLQLPWQESAEQAKERKRRRNMTPLTTPQFEKEASDLVSTHQPGLSYTHWS